MKGVAGSRDGRLPRIPVAAFLDVPRLANPQPEFLRHCDCGNPCMGSRCDRCAKADTRESFLAKWADRAFDEGAVFDAILEQVGWANRNYDAAEERAAWRRAIENGAEPEVFRQIMIDAGLEGIIEARDAAKQRGREVALAKLKARGPRSPIVPLLKLSDADAKRHARELLEHKRYAGRSWWNTGTDWSYRDQIELQIFCAAGVPLEQAANALGRSATSVAWRARDWCLSSPSEWRAAIRQKRKPREEKWAPLAYPYVQTERDENADLLEVNGLVGRYLPGREDICQEIMLALWEKRVTMDVLRKQGANLRAFVRQFFKANFELAGYARSLDAPIMAGSDLRLIDTI